MDRTAALKAAARRVALERTTVPVTVCPPNRRPLGTVQRGPQHARTGGWKRAGFRRQG